MMQTSQILAALQERLDGVLGKPTGNIDSLPTVVKKWVNALKNLQVILPWVLLIVLIVMAIL